jgi:hypothetical protein
MSDTKTTDKQATPKRSAPGRGLSPELRKKMLDKLTPNQKDLFERLASLNDKARAKELESCWELGRYVHEADEDQKGYGRRFVSTAASLLGVSAAFMYNRMNFYGRFQDESKFGELVRFCGQEGRTLTYSHVEKLLEQDDESMWQYLRQAAQGSWTVSQLGQVVRTNSGQSGRRSDTRGRTVAVPADVAGQIDSLHFSLSPVRKRAEVWADKERGLRATVEQTPNERLEAAWIDHLVTAETDLEETIAWLCKVRDDWAKARQYLVDTLDGGKKNDRKKVSEKKTVKSSWREDAALDIFDIAVPQEAT